MSTFDRAVTPSPLPRDGSLPMTGDLTVQSAGPAEIHIEADTDNTDEDNGASLRLSQDGGLVEYTVGTESSNALHVRGSVALHMNIPVRFDSVEHDAIFTVASGWSLNDATAWVFGNFALLFVDVERSGGTITVPSTGDTANQTLGTFGAEARGAFTQWQGLSTSVVGRVGGFSYRPSTGDVVLGAVAGSGNIVNGDRFYATGMVVLDVTA